MGREEDLTEKIKYHYRQIELAKARHNETEALRALAQSPRDFKTALKYFEYAACNYRIAGDNDGAERINEKMESSGVRTYQGAQLLANSPYRDRGSRWFPARETRTESELFENYSRRCREVEKLFRSIGCIKEAEEAKQRMEFTLNWERNL